MKPLKPKIESRLLGFFEELKASSDPKFLRTLLNFLFFSSKILARSNAYMYNYRIAYGVCVCGVSFINFHSFVRTWKLSVCARARTYVLYKRGVFIQIKHSILFKHIYQTHTSTRARTHSVPFHWNRAIYFIILCVCVLKLAAFHQHHPYSHSHSLIETRYIAHTQYTCIIDHIIYYRVEYIINVIGKQSVGCCCFFGKMCATKTIQNITKIKSNRTQPNKTKRNEMEKNRPME